jgi:hypothetical protein
MPKYELTEDEKWLRDCHVAKRKAIESLSFNCLFEYNNFFIADKKDEAHQYLLKNAVITENEKELLKNYFSNKTGI